MVAKKVLKLLSIHANIGVYGSRYGNLIVVLARYPRPSLNIKEAVNRVSATTWINGDLFYKKVLHGSL